MHTTISYHPFYPLYSIQLETVDITAYHREELVDIDRSKMTANDPSAINYKNSTIDDEALLTASLGLPSMIVGDKEGEKKKKGNYPYHFRLVLSNNVTPAVKSLISTENPQIKEIMIQPGIPLYSKPLELKPGDGFEISPLAISQCEDIAARVKACSGAALLIDYGEDHVQEDTIRGFKKHKSVHILSEVNQSRVFFLIRIIPISNYPFSLLSSVQPGTVDITADVNFDLCRKSAEKKGTFVYPLVTQGKFLMNMGIIQRVEQLINDENISDEQANYVFSGMKKLVLPTEMGEKFKVLGICHPSLKDKLVGFEK